MSKVKNLYRSDCNNHYALQNHPPHELAKGRFHDFSVGALADSHVLVVSDQIQKASMQLSGRLAVLFVLRMNLLVFVLGFHGVFKADDPVFPVVGSRRLGFSPAARRHESVLQAQTDLLIRLEGDPEDSLRGTPSRTKEDVLFLGVQDDDADGFGTQFVVQEIKVPVQGPTGGSRGDNIKAVFVVCGYRYDVGSVDELVGYYAREDCENHQN